MAVLRATRGLDGGAAYELKQPAVLLGRNPKRCDVVLEHYAVSREHARVEVVDSDFYIEDLKSRNGVRLNGRRLQPGAEGRQRLQVGDRIEIAAFEFYFEEALPIAGMVSVLDDVQKPDIVSTFHVGSDSSIKSRSGSKAGRLNILVGIIEDLSRELDFAKVLPKIVSSLLRAFPQAHNGCLLLRREDGEFAPAAVERNGGEGEPMRVSRAILDDVVANRQAVLSTDSKSDSQPGGDPENHQPRTPSVMSAPLLDCDDVVFGVLQLDVQQGTQPFTPEDLELLSAVATHLAAVIENSRLHDSVLREQRSRYEARFRKLIEGSLQGILIHRHFRPLFVNEAWAALHGYSVAEVLGMDSTLNLIAPEERDWAVALAKSWLQGDDPPPRYESKHLRKDGTPIWVEKFSSVVDWDGGPAVQTAVVDLTHRKQAEEALRLVHEELEQRVADRTAELARSNRDLEQFAYSASHDLQAPLRTIASYCQLLQQRYGEKLDAGAHEFLDGAIEGAQRMKRLLDDLLGYARVTTEANSFRSADCNAVLQEVLRNLNAQAKECSAAITSDPLPTVCCDATQLIQIFQNLISNAIAYRSEEPLQIHVGAEEREEDWCFSVRDNGVGIAPKYFARIFQIFQRLYAEHEHPGSGVGLSLCKRIVERHGGGIWVESTPGSGSVFYFTIPKRQTPSNAEAD